MELLRKYILLQWLVAGGLLGVPFIFPIAWIVGVVGGMYFIYLLLLPQSWKVLLVGSWAAWTIKSLAALSWFWSTYPIDWMPVDLGSTQLAVIFFYWFTNAMSVGSGAVFVAVFVRLARRYWSRPSVLLSIIIPTVWVLGEMVGSIMFSIVTFGPGGTVNSSFSFGYSGYILAESPLFLLFAKLGGVYGLSFIFVSIAGLGVTLVQVVRLQQQYIVLAGLLLLYSTTFFSPAPLPEVLPDERYTVVAIDTRFPMSALQNRQTNPLATDELRLAITAALQEESDYILLPEDSRFFNQQQPTEFTKSFFTFQYHNPNVIIVDSGRADVEGKTTLQAFIYDGVADTVDLAQKKYLVPQGEFMPVLYASALKLFGYGDVIESISRTISYEVGNNTSQAQFAETVPGVLFCFESVSPFGVRSLMQERPDIPFIAHPISHAWFHEPEGLWYQLDRMLQVQAVWNDVYIVSAGSHVAGKVYASNGQMVPFTTVKQTEFWTMKSVRIPY